MKEEKYLYKIEIPAGVSAAIEGETVVVRKGEKESRRKLNPLVKLEIKDREIVLSIEKKRKREKKMFGTTKAHIKNMIKGLTEDFKYRLQVSNVHFPMNVSYDKEKKEIVVKNFLGEKKDRRIKMVDNVEVKVNRDIIELTSHDIEKAGQAATRIEKGTRVRNKDRRVYQDGIFLIEKPGRSFL